MGAVDSIESFGLVDGPGIRTVVFLSGCKLRCKYCHNPEMWVRGKDNYEPIELVKKIIRFKPYWARNNGGVTFSGGEPLLQVDFLIETCKLLKKENINIVLDTAGVGIGKYEEILKYVDLILFDVKHTNHEEFKNLTGIKDDETFKFLKVANKMNKKFWIRQVIVPGLMNNLEYLKSLKMYLNNNIKNIEKVDFLPYHKLGGEKYISLGITNPYLDMPAMDAKTCEELYQKFINL